MESLHPIVVHFPIALIFSALLVETLALQFRKPSWYRISLWNLGLGGLGVVVAVITGRLAMAVAKHSYEIHRIMWLHERLGYAASVVVLGILAFRLFTRDRLSSRSRLIAWLILVLVCAVIGYSSHLGGRMVYEFGVGGSYGKSTGIVVQ